MMEICAEGQFHVVIHVVRIDVVQGIPNTENAEHWALNFTIYIEIPCIERRIVERLNKKRT